MKRVIGTTRVTSETKSNVSSGPMSATVFFELLIRTVPTGRRRNTAARTIAPEPRVGSKSEVNKDFNTSDNLKRENPSLESYGFTGKKRLIEDQTREVSAKRPQLLTVGTVLQDSNTFNILELTLPSFSNSRPDDRSQEFLSRERHELENYVRARCKSSKSLFMT